MNIFSNGKNQSIIDVLNDKDERVKQQQDLLSNNQSDILICVKLNIPGPIKHNKEIQQIFTLGTNQLLKLLKQSGTVIKQEIYWHKDVGDTGFVLLNSNDKDKIKRLTIDFEDHELYGRLFDVDVVYYSNNNVKSVSRTELNLPVRKCLLCEHPAKECARSRKHSVQELQDKINELYGKIFN